MPNPKSMGIHILLGFKTLSAFLESISMHSVFCSWGLNPEIVVPYTYLNSYSPQLQ